jgi:hypothetical protein
VLTIEVTFTLAQANNDIVDNLPKSTVARGRRLVFVLLLSSSYCNGKEKSPDDGD